MPGVIDRMELKKVSTDGDDDSTDSLNDDRYTEPIDSEKATINRSAAPKNTPKTEDFIYTYLYLYIYGRETI